MYRKGKILLLLLLLVSAAALPSLGSRTVYGIADGGAYRMVTQTETAFAPWIWFDMSGQNVRFTSVMDSRISCVTSGTVAFRHGKVYAVSENETQIWVFDVSDNNTLVFETKGSVIPTDREGNPIIPEGAVFKCQAE